MLDVHLAAFPTNHILLVKQKDRRDSLVVVAMGFICLKRDPQRGHRADARGPQTAARWC